MRTTFAFAKHQIFTHYVHSLDLSVVFPSLMLPFSECSHSDVQHVTAFPFRAECNLPSCPFQRVTASGKRQRVQPDFALLYVSCHCSTFMNVPAVVILVLRIYSGRVAFRFPDSRRWSCIRHPLVFWEFADYRRRILMIFPKRGQRHVSCMNLSAPSLISFTAASLVINRIALNHESFSRVR